MNRIIMSMSEILRVGVWSLRALGLPFGTAERAVRLLALAEAVQGGAVRMLRVAEAEIMRASALPQPARSRDGLNQWSMDAGGKHLLEIGGPAIDLATADARNLGAGHLSIHGAIGIWLVPALCELAVSRKLAIVAVYAAGADETLPPGVDARGWIAGVAVGTEPRFLSGGLGSGKADIVSLLRQSPLSATAAVERWIESDAALSRPGSIGLSLWSATPALRTWPGDLPTIDIPGRIMRAYRMGVEVDTIDCDHLYAVERRTWAPTSERSRNQAGFGRYGDAKS